jgi:dysferlin
MVEVDMTPGRLPSAKMEDIKIVDLNKLAPYLSRSSYRLYCAFHSATMVHPYDEPVEFEVSIGNYGNKLDSDSPVQLSTTPPCNPVYDGKQYYYLPWMDQKPVVQVCPWDSSLMLDELYL